jgi:glycosyltransferase involved in cell wall biosynthesis
MEPTIDGHATLRDRDMLCFSHDWNGDPLSKTHLMRLLARRNRVLWVNSIGYRTPSISRRDAGRVVKKALAALSPLQEPEPNLFVLNPIAVPAHGKPWVRSFNRWLLQHQVRGAMANLGFQRPINWVFNPAAAVVAGTLDEDMLIYYCVDEYSAFHGVRAETLRVMEEDLLAKADLVITSAERLWHAKKQANPATFLVRHGVDWKHFRRALDPRTPVPADLASIRGPILGYFGLIGSDWVDQELIESVARRMPNVSFVMIGKITTDVTRLRAMPNIHLLGHRPYSSLPEYCRGFDAAFIPFPISDATLNSNPLKAREYLAAGLPVISTAIPEVEALGLGRIATDAASFAVHAAEALAEPGPQQSLSDAMRGESWEARLADIEGLIASVASDRMPGMSNPERLAA